MKKTVLSILVLVLMLSCTACQDKNITASPASPTGSSETTPTPSDTPDTTLTPTNLPDVTSTPTDTPKATPTGTPVATNAPSATPTGAPDPETRDLIGYIDGNSYVNNFLKLRFTLPVDWAFLSGAQLAALSSLTEDIYGDAFAAVGADFSKNIIVMEATSPGGKNSVNINLLKLKPSELALYSKLNAEELAKQVAKETKEGFPLLGIDAGEMTVTNFNFIGESSYYIAYYATSAAFSNGKFISFVLIKDEYFATITLFSATDANISTLFESFTSTSEKVPERKTFDAKEPVVVGNVIGRIENDTYLNEVFNLFFTCPEGWQFIDGTTLASVYNLSGDLYSDITVSDLFNASSSPFIMYAVNPNPYAELKISLELPPNRYVLTADPGELIEAIANTLVDEYSQLGINCTVPVISEKQIMGETMCILNYTLSTAEESSMITQFFIQKDPYLITVSLISAPGSSLDILDCFWSTNIGN